MQPKILTKRAVASLRRGLSDWYEREARDLPWRRTKDPYLIWISEVMLQQTRVDQALPYYERFVRAFPTVVDLGRADLSDVLRIWEGLGYYTRARNLHAAARAILQQHGGDFPRAFADIRALPGVGTYTAAAVASLAFSEPRAVVDGNVARVLARLYGIDQAPANARARNTYARHAETLLDRKHPARHNQAMMELGARICTPANPLCAACPLAPWCTARKAGAQNRFPPKRVRPPVPHYNVAVGIIGRGGTEVLIQRRPESGLLGGLWEFPGGKQEDGEDLSETCARELREELGIEVEVDELFFRLSHAYTHFKVTLHAFRCRLLSGVPDSRTGRPLVWASLSDLERYAFPRANRKLIAELRSRTGPAS